MANAYTDTAAMGSLVQTAYDRLVEFALRSQPLFRDVADKRPAQQAMPGSSITLERYQDLAQATTALTEDVDPDAVAIGNPNTVTLTLNEYGNAVLRTRKLNLFTLSDVDPAIANIVAYNMGDSVDTLVQNVLRHSSATDTGTTNGNVIRKLNGTVSYTPSGSAPPASTAMVSTDTMSSNMIRLAVAKLRTNKAFPKKGSLYWTSIHPEVSLDLRQETGSAAWRDPHVYSAPGSIWAGEIGQYEGAFFIESPRCYNTDDAGSGGNTVKRFRTYMAGQQALAEAVAEDFHVIVGPVTDKLMRARPIGWYGVAGWAIYREEALVRIECTSSIDNS
jgi:N4-gp56 family major capsid protein